MSVVILGNKIETESDGDEFSDTYDHVSAVS